MDIEKELQLIRKELERITAMGRPLPALLTREEFAQQLSLSTSTVDRMIANGEVRLALSSKKRRPRIPASEVGRLSAPVQPPKRVGGRRKTAHVDSAQEAAKARAFTKRKH